MTQKMKPDNPRAAKLRRRLLTQSAVGAAVIGTLPAHWTSPVVESVVLPAHAQTSVSSATPCPTLVIPGITLTCPTAPPATIVAYGIDDMSARCPTLETVAIAVNDSTILVQDNSAVGQSRRFIKIGLGSDENHGFISCVPVVQFMPMGAFTGTIAATSGARYQASYTVAGDTTSVTVSDITLTPV